MDIYEERTPEQVNEVVSDESSWKKEAPWVVEGALLLKQIVDRVYGNTTLKYLQNYISIVYGKNNHFSLHLRNNDKSLIYFWVSRAHIDQITRMLDDNSITYRQRHQNQVFYLTMTKNMMEKYSEMLCEIAKIVKASWSDE